MEIKTVKALNIPSIIAIGCALCLIVIGYMTTVDYPPSDSVRYAKEGHNIDRFIRDIEKCDENSDKTRLLELINAAFNQNYSEGIQQLDMRIRKYREDVAFCVVTLHRVHNIGFKGEDLIFNESGESYAADSLVTYVGQENLLFLARKVLERGLNNDMFATYSSLNEYSIRMEGVLKFCKRYNVSFEKLNTFATYFKTVLDPAARSEIGKRNHPSKVREMKANINDIESNIGKLEEKLGSDSNHILSGYIATKLNDYGDNVYEIVTGGKVAVLYTSDVEFSSKGKFQVYAYKSDPVLLTKANGFRDEFDVYHQVPYSEICTLNALKRRLLDSQQDLEIFDRKVTTEDPETLSMLLVKAQKILDSISTNV